MSHMSYLGVRNGSEIPHASGCLLDRPDDRSHGGRVRFIPKDQSCAEEDEVPILELAGEAERLIRSNKALLDSVHGNQKLAKDDQ